MRSKKSLNVGLNTTRYIDLETAKRNKSHNILTGNEHRYITFGGKRSSSSEDIRLVRLFKIQTLVITLIFI